MFYTLKEMIDHDMISCSQCGGNGYLTLTVSKPCNHCEGGEYCYCKDCEHCATSGFCSCDICKDKV